MLFSVTSATLTFHLTRDAGLQLCEGTLSKHVLLHSLECSVFTGPGHTCNLAFFKPSRTVKAMETSILGNQGPIYSLRNTLILKSRHPQNIPFRNANLKNNHNVSKLPQLPLGASTLSKEPLWWK